MRVIERGKEMTNTSEVRPIDRARARAAALAVATGDGMMLTNAVADAADDPEPLAIHLMIAALAEDAVSIAIDAAGNSGVEDPPAAVVEGLRRALAASAAAADTDDKDRK
ncbi:hypothetical protein [Microbacterium invictum]|uniref:Uncharacterized protein n=1 Tax=Microbacterium invictum TaxID=515415 RepID=A0ABZ0V601_9MICO|nr:hypothetical protein [Microbacterium invictum]WQB69025.1 hypothetical protein T9R20_09905 [Microbacterium invictum]